MNKKKLFLVAGVLGVASAASVFTLANTRSSSAIRDHSTFRIHRASGGETLILEAENGDITGTPHVAGEDFVEVGKTSDNPAHPTSGGNSVGYWATQGNKIKLTVKAEDDVQGIAATWWICNGETSSKALEGNLKVTVNGTEIAWGTNTMPARSGNAWANWQGFTMAEEINLEKGKNFIVIENVTGVNAGVDCLELALPSNAADVNEALPDKEAPVISNVRVDGESYVGKEVEVKFDLSDNECASEDIKVDFKCTYAFGTEDASNIVIENGKFTPEKAGKYTVQITATDDAGNASKQSKIVVDVIEAPSKGSTKKVWKDSDTGWTVFGITTGLSAVMIGIMVFMKLKRKTN